MKVLVINGAGHSGSTILDCVLGSFPGVVAVGEVRRIWRYGVLENRRCACGQQFLDCPFWSAVGEDAFGGWDRRFAHNQLRAQDRLLTSAGLLRLRLGRLGPLRADFKQFAASRRALVEAIGRAAGAELVVDSSKSGPYGAALAAIPGLDVRGLHLSRDPHGYVYSAMRRRPRGGSARFPGLGARRTARLAAWWGVRNLGAELAWVGSRRGLRYRYEAFATGPARAAQRILRFAGVATAPEPGRRTFTLAGNHTLGGNSLRYETGEITVRLDDAWRSGMPAPSRHLVTAVTAPLLARYGYLNRR